MPVGAETGGSLPLLSWIRFQRLPLSEPSLLLRGVTGFTGKGGGGLQGLSERRRDHSADTLISSNHNPSATSPT